jgi:hypothetical protein
VKKPRFLPIFFSASDLLQNPRAAQQFNDAPKQISSWKIMKGLEMPSYGVVSAKLLEGYDGVRRFERP